MHFEILAEDKSGGVVLDIVMEKIFGANGSRHSWRVHPYKGLGRVPKNLRGAGDPARRLLLDRLPALLRGYGKSLDDSSAVVVTVDCDDRDCRAFKRELLDVLEACAPRPNALFRIAIEESEAWLLGDRAAVKAAYPNAKDAVLDGYAQDSICGTWELLADAVRPGGARRLRRAGWPAPGRAKREWAERIAPRMNPDGNRSPSFRAFRDGVRRLAEKSGRPAEKDA